MASEHVLKAGDDGVPIGPNLIVLGLIVSQAAEGQRDLRMPWVFVVLLRATASKY